MSELPPFGDFSVLEEEAGEDIIRRWNLADREDLDEFAERTGYPIDVGLRTRCWNMLARAGLYFPDSPQAVAQSRGYIPENPLFYYPHEWLTPDLLVLGADQSIDYEQGIAGDFAVRGFSTEAVLRLQIGSRLEMHSLKAFIKSGNLIRLPLLGAVMARFLEDFCDCLGRRRGIERGRYGQYAACE